MTQSAVDPGGPDREARADARAEGGGDVVIPVVQEELTAESRPVRTGSIRVTTRVREVPERVDLPLVREVVDVRRVPVGRVVDAPPPVRTVADTVIVPVVEEELVLSTRWVVKEEIHLTRRRSEESRSEEHGLLRTEVQIEHLDAEGRVIAAERPD